MKDFRTLEIWQKSYQLALDIYKVSEPFPQREVYGLTNQIRRAAVSIPSNIAEGCGRDSDAELARFVQIAWGQPVNWSVSCKWYMISAGWQLTIINDLNRFWLLSNVK